MYCGVQFWELETTVHIIHWQIHRHACKHKMAKKNMSTVDQKATKQKHNLMQETQFNHETKLP